MKVFLLLDGKGKHRQHYQLPSQGHNHKTKKTFEKQERMWELLSYITVLLVKRMDTTDTLNFQLNSSV